MEKEKATKIAEAIKGQLGDETLVTVTERRKYIKGPDFVMIYQEVGKRILEGNISLSTSKVFFYLIMNMSFENFIGIDQKSLGENIKMPLPTVKKALRELKDANMLMSIKNNHDSRRNDYRLNPIIGWKGKQRNKIKMLKENLNQTNLFSTE